MNWWENTYEKNLTWNVFSKQLLSFWQQEDYWKKMKNKLINR